MSRPHARRFRLSAGLAPILIVLGALPLMAPTCGSPGEGYKTFSRLSLIIPMDVCYQYQTDADNLSGFTPVGCPQATDPGSVIKAYGLVYELIRNGVPVYWIIDPSKGRTGDPNYGVTGIDLTVQYNGGVPVFFYDWTNGGQFGAPTTANHFINYRGGPFVVDGSDYAKASAVLQQFKATFSTVNVHVSNVAFKGYAKRTMAGGWSAGGATPPKLALLDIGSSGAGAKNSEFVIQGYLAQAGLDVPNCTPTMANPCPGGTTTGVHGTIYDHLYMPDFIPTVGTDPHRTTLFQNGYQILWIPHWAAPSSCSDCPPGPSCTCANHYDPVTIGSALKTIGAFVTEGRDLFAECAGLGSLEGVFSGTPPSTSGNSTIYLSGDATTHFQTSSPSGLWIETNTPSGSVIRGPYDSPLTQIGDFRFTAHSGAISDWRAARYTPPVDPSLADSTIRIITETVTEPAWDIFTIRGRYNGRGSAVYLGGHSYSGNDGNFQIAGTRLVLNTLFNLGAACIPTSLPCNTGLYGICAQGAWGCDANGQPACIQTVFPQPEICNGLDDNCNGAVDEGLTTDCYAPPPGYVDPLGRTPAQVLATRNHGVCIGGVSSCQRNADGTFGMSACVGQVLPTAESCNGLDDDCDDAVDNGLVQACYDGPAYSLDASGNPMGTCRAGTQWCQSGAWGAPLGAGFVPGVCQGEVLPAPEACSPDPGGATTALDTNCDGQLPTCGCTSGATRPCFSGPGTPGVGICRAGIQTCTAGSWGECSGEQVAILYQPEPCTTPAKPAADPGYKYFDDWNCDGRTTQCTACNGTQSEACWGSWGASDPGPMPSEAGKGQCHLGSRTCQGGAWGACVGYGLPSPIEYCDGQDNNCNGTVDESAVCPTGSTCLRGVCVPSACGTERPPPEGYVCSSSTSGVVQPGACGSSPAPGCAVGALCQYGTCVDPCPVSPTQVDPDTLLSVSLVCAKGTVCGGGACIAGGCYEQGCAPGQLCQQGSCVPDPCAGKNCPSGTFCRQGDCVQACTFVTCAVGQKCGIDGFCVGDPCASATCNAGQKCGASGTCVADPCNGLACASGQVCDSSSGAALCVDDPCVGVKCPAGVCVLGQCFDSGNPGGKGTASTTSSSSSGCHCGSGGAAALPALLGLLLAPLVRRRRRRADEGQHASLPPSPGGGEGRGEGHRRGGMTALLVVLLSVAFAASGCKKSDTTFDPSGCAATCGEQRCVDVANDPTHCGACNLACAAGQQCKSSVCGPGGYVAPYIGAIAPSSATKDNAAFAVTLSGERFQAGATVRMATATGPRTVPCPASPGGACQWMSAGSIQLTVDLTGLPVTSGTAPFTFRVVNPDGVISNAVPLAIGVPVPQVAGVVPNTVVSGDVANLVVSGTGFTGGSQCHLTGAVIGDIGLPTVLNGNELDCQLDTAAVPAGAYQLLVVSEASPPTRSNSVGVTVTPNDPVISFIDPTSGTSSTSLSVTGARFDATSKIVFDTTVITSTLYLDPAHLYVASFALPGAPGNYGVHVQNGTTTLRNSNVVSFTVGGSPPAITSFTPATAYQGNPTVALTFTGTGFPASSGIEVAAPGSSTYTFLASSASTSTSVTATLSLVNGADGTWNVRVRLGPAGSPSTVAWPLRVLSNQAILRSYSATPLPAQSGQVGDTKTGFTFNVSNLQGWTPGGVPDLSGVRVAFFDPAFPGTVIHSLAPSPTPSPGATTFDTPGFSLAGLTAGVYAFTVNNPNATASNALTFAVNPGPPTLTSVCKQGTGPGTGTACVATASQASGSVALTLIGTNFAPPDQNGNGSTVMVAADFMTGYPSPDPCGATTGGTQLQLAPGTLVVNGPTQITFTVDLRSAFVDVAAGGTTYYVEVYNPSGSGAPLKSGCGVAITSLPPFRITP